jgi:uncharacterized membrane protein
MLLAGLLLLVIAFIVPVVSLISVAGVKRRLRWVEDKLDQQRRALDELTNRLHEVRKVVDTDVRQRAPAEPAKPAATERPRPPIVEPSAMPVRPTPAPSAAVTPSRLPEPGVAPSPAPAVPSAADVARTSTPVTTQAPPRPRTPRIDREGPPPIPPRPTPPRPPPPEPFDWERLIGVKMFSAVAGIALVLAAVFFLRYSIDQGWLGPPIRTAIGVLTGIALLVVCDLKAARRYPTTANAMDAAAIAILFSTFFAAHALWHLIPAAVAFGLLALVTTVAVLLSIRRDSLFIAVLGLLGGFATPVLLSTGENRPVGLFAYLFLLNIGLAWVAYRKRWPALTILTLGFTTLYQWGWVIRFLTASQLSLAMGIFLLFAVTGFSALVFGARASADELEGRTLEKTGLAAAVMPLFFAVYLATVPAYGARPGLLFGFLLIVDAGLLAVTIARGEEFAHALGAGAAVLVFVMWLATSYVSGAWTTVTAFTVAFVGLFALAPVVAARLSKPLTGLAAQAQYAAPILLFVFPVIARIEPAAAAPLKLFAPLFALLALIAWRALAANELPLYFIAAFFGLAAEASWSATHLTPDHLRAAELLYAAFGLFYLGVPLIARHTGRHIVPRWSGGAVLIASLLLLLFLASGTRPPTSLWGLAVLLAILDAGIFVEGASGGLPAVSIIGGALSWVVLAVWWQNAAAAVGLLPSLLFLVGLTLMMLVGHAWAHRWTAGKAISDTPGFGFRHGTYLGLIGHLFLFFVAVDPRWSTPPWPLFGALAALALATVAIPLQLSHQWITIGWALEGAALAWTYRRIPHRGLLYWGLALLAAVFVRLALNPAVFIYEPRGYRVFNWYLYAYVICGAAMFLAAWWYAKTEDQLIDGLPRASALLPAAGVVLLFLLLNIEIADYYATGPEITFRFGVTLAQDLTYTIGWLVFGLLLLTAGIYLHNRPARIAAVAFIAATAFKAFLYDMGSLGGLYRVFSLVGLAMSLALVALALQKYVLRDFRNQP